ncbi:Thiamine biosynthetic bifunctional enzyme [Coniochaeta hoffmannii]|uniref:Thiamine biosynthetic bifunctional enzyme n=1 Tax=Coniochaeta hoffmannii TaxID=91930 RepID=A0AA38R3I5_9PEZI|nr:Thiamine biosynthetic bifunctional enzyme [Coniochaeta hoffmannii]
MEACCTCARLLSAVPLYSEKSEKLVPQDRLLGCCRRTICGDCLLKNPRFESYCPYCQITSTPSLLPQGLKEPPSYTSLPNQLPTTDAPPPAYTSLAPPSYPDSSHSQPPTEKPAPQDSREPILHFLNHSTDTLPSLSLSYSVPIAQIRSLNRLTSDHLLAARKTILIPQPSVSSPGSSSAAPPAVSLSPVPVEGEEEEIRKNKIRRWMVATKVADYDVAVLYLEQEGYNLAQAVARFLGDEEWERGHPLDKGKRKGKGVLRLGGGSRVRI